MDGRLIMAIRFPSFADRDDGRPLHIPHLLKHHFLILPDTMELRFEHGASHRHCTISGRQVPIEPRFVMTVHKAQGQTMRRVIVDLASCTGTEAPYVMVLRATSLQGVKVCGNLTINK